MTGRVASAPTDIKRDVQLQYASTKSALVLLLALGVLTENAITITAIQVNIIAMIVRVHPEIIVIKQYVTMTTVMLLVHVVQ